MMEIRNLTFAYKKGGPEVLSDISFRLEPGRLVAVLGANGAGKTTLFKCILGFHKQYGGRVLLDGREIRSLSRKEIAERIAYIPQTEIPVYNYTVLDTVMMGTTAMISPLRSPGAEQEQIAKEAMERLGISNLSGRGISEISGGERQLSLLARALAQKAQILIMDEPTANLDYGNQQLVMRQIQRMAQEGYTILLSTHNPEHALQYATDVLAIKERRVLADGPADAVLNETLIEQIYGLKVKITEAEVEGVLVRSCIPLASVTGERTRSFS